MDTILFSKWLRRTVRINLLLVSAGLLGCGGCGVGCGDGLPSLPSTLRCARLDVKFAIARTGPDGHAWDRGLPAYQPPDPTGELTVERDGRTLASEGIAQREDAYEFTASFFRKVAGIELRPGDTVRLDLMDADPAESDRIDSAHVPIGGVRSTGRSDASLFDAEVICIQDS